MKFVPSERCKSTKDEAWTLQKPRGPRRGAYAIAAEFVEQNIGPVTGSCLVVGSPIFEAQMLIEKGWQVTYLDVRVPPVKFERFVKCDAAAMTFEDESFDAVSSTCVLSHVGMGRYGDPVVQRGDEKALGHMARVLKRGGVATIMFGNVAVMESSVVLGTCHRIYTMQDCRRMLDEVGLEILKTGLWSREKAWFTDENEITKDFNQNTDYVTFKVKK